jgi:hypothetical protein
MGADRLGYIVKGVRKLVVSIMNQEMKGGIVLLKVPDELPGLLSDQG